MKLPRYYNRSLNTMGIYLYTRSRLMCNVRLVKTSTHMGGTISLRAHGSKAEAQIGQMRTHLGDYFVHVNPKTLHPF